MRRKEPRMTRPLIAVVNDDTTFLELMNELLTEEGYRTILLKEGDRAYQSILKEKPDLIILDIRLEHPEMGWMILELIRLNPVTTDIPVIIASADSTALKAKAELLAKQEIDSLEKPFRLQELVAKIEKYLPNAADPKSS